MTEAEWKTSADPQAMLDFATERRLVEVGSPGAGPWPWCTPRKLRLFACACCRQAGDGVPCPHCSLHGSPLLLSPGKCPVCHSTRRIGGLTDPRSRRAVEVAERYADGEATFEELRTADKVSDELILPGWTEHTGHPALAASWCADSRRPAEAIPRMVLRNLPDQSPAVQAALLRCLVGNPWTKSPCGCRSDYGPHDDPRCPVRRWCEWDGGTVPLLARAVYAENDWSPGRLGILADALTDAGVPEEEACPRCNGQNRVMASEFRDGWQWNQGDPCPGCVDGRVPHVIVAHLRGLDTGPCPHCYGGQTVGGTGYDPVLRQLTGTECDVCHGTGRAPAVHARGCHAVDCCLGRR